MRQPTLQRTLRQLYQRWRHSIGMLGLAFSLRFNLQSGTKPHYLAGPDGAAVRLLCERPVLA